MTAAKLLWAFAPLALVAAPLRAADSDPPAPAAAPVVTITGPALRSSDLDRSIKFYTEGLGLVAHRLDAGANIEIVFNAPVGAAPPILMVYKSKDPTKSPPIEMGNGFGRVMLAVTDAAALAARLKAAGYAPGEIRGSAGGTRIFFVKDPDGYAFEIAEHPAAKPQ